MKLAFLFAYLVVYSLNVFAMSKENYLSSIEKYHCADETSFLNNFIKIFDNGAARNNGHKKLQLCDQKERLAQYDSVLHTEYLSQKISDNDYRHYQSVGRSNLIIKRLNEGFSDFLYQELSKDDNESATFSRSTSRLTHRENVNVVEGYKTISNEN